MKASDVMVRDFVTVTRDATVADVAALMSEHDVSALPVVDDERMLVGIISEADLLHRHELGTEIQPSWWMEAMLPQTKLAQDYLKSHTTHVSELMSAHVVTAQENTPLSDLAALLERNRIKRVPITRDGKLVGIVSRANLIQALASAARSINGHLEKDRDIRHEVLVRLDQQSWTDFGKRNVIVNNGTVHIWGLVGSESERKALIALVEAVPGVLSVSDEMIPAY
eukprot:gene8141-8225_t